jgi:hypothetical protein
LEDQGSKDQADAQDLDQVFEPSRMVHPVGRWEHFLLQICILDLSVCQDVHVDLSKDHSKGDVLKLSPWLGNDVLWPIVIVSTYHSNFEAIFIGHNHVFHNVVSDHDEIKEKAESRSFPRDDSKNRNDEGYLHVYLKWPCLPEATCVWRHLLWNDITDHEKSWKPLIITCLILTN